ncbi:MAG: protein-export chaperone SecB [Candidatus Wallbacteria bacterium]
MNINNQPGILFKNIILTKLNFSRSAEHIENPDLAVDFTAAKKIENNVLMFELSSKIFEKNKKDAFELSCSMVGYFSTDEENPNMSLEKFSEYNAPALMLPYIREVVANTTLRSGLKPVILPPFNIVALINKNKQNEQNIEK